MMPSGPSTNYDLAVRDFHRARQSAVLRQMLARLRRQSTQLLDYEEICQQLRSTEKRIDRGVVEIPLQKIVGSVGRFRDFTREFLPKHMSDESRWATVKTMMIEMSGMPPIEVYQIGDAYFVLDGNHRVSVARKAGALTIAAHVTEIQTRVPFAADDDPNEVICKARYADFLSETDLDQAVPDIDLLMTVAGHYQTLLHQISLHRQTAANDVAELGLGDRPIQQNLSIGDAAASWYRKIYLPVVHIMRELGVMRRFPNRTETDIYVLLSERRSELERELHWELDLEDSLPNLVQLETTENVKQRSRRFFSKVVGRSPPNGPEHVAVGSWRTQQLAMHREGRLFADLLVLFEGIDEDWKLLEAALSLGAQDHDRILGLAIVEDTSQLERSWVREMSARFYRRCQSAKLTGEFAVEAGPPAAVLLRRAAWADLVFINLTHPPESNVLDRLRSFWGPIIANSPRPLLIAPHAFFNGMSPMLLAYDGSPKADEALFVATYNASRWQHELTVLTVETAMTSSIVLDKARVYLEEHDVHHAQFCTKRTPVGLAIMDTAEEIGCNVIIMGGFGANPVRRLIQGSVVEYVLQHTRSQSVIICQ